MDAGVAVDQGHSVDDLGVIDQDHGQHDHGHLHRQEVSVAHGVLPGAVPCILERLRLVRLPQLCYVVCQRIIWVRCREKSLDGEKDGSDLKCWTPFLFEDVQADSSQLVDVRVVDPSDEPYFGSSHWVVFR